MLNAWQMIAARSYADGDYIDRAEKPHDCGDTLFNFIISELSTNAGCNSDTEAVRRLEGAIRDIEVVLAALDEVP